MAPWTLEEHQRHAADMHRINDLHTWYVREIHAKKCVYSGDDARYTFRCADDESFCRREVFYGAEVLGHVFDQFRFEMETLLYISEEEVDKENMYTNEHSITRDGLALSNAPTLTDTDRRVIRAHNEEYVRLMRTCMSQTLFYLYDLNVDDGNYQNMMSWCRRVEAANRWGLVSSAVRAYFIASYLQGETQRRMCAGGGRGRRQDAEMFRAFLDGD